MRTRPSRFRRWWLPVVAGGGLLLFVSQVVSAQSTPWQQAGPFRGGSPKAMLVAGDGTVYLGTWGGGVLRSEDAGNTWQPSGEGLKDRHVRALAALGSTVFAGTRQGGVFRSEDSGTTWIETNSGLKKKRVSALAGGESAMYAGTDGGVYRYAPASRAWTETALTPQRVTALVAAGRTLYAAGRRGISRSKDGGDSWEELNDGLSDRRVECLLILAGTVYAGTYNQGVFHLAPDSRTWQRTPLGETVRGSSLRVRALTQGGGALYAGTHGYGVWVSADAGRSWAEANQGIGELAVGAITVTALGASESQIYAALERPIVYRKGLR